MGIRHGTRTRRELVLPETIRAIPAVTIGDLTLVRGLALGGVRSVAVAAQADDVTLRSRHLAARWVVPELRLASTQARDALATSMLERAEAIGSRFGVPLPLFFGTDRLLAWAHANRRLLTERYALLLNDDSLARDLLDKRRFFDRARALGIRTPHCLEGDSARGPLLVKPRTKLDWSGPKASLFGGVGKARTFGSRRELYACPEFREHESALVVQPYLAPARGGLVSFHGLADRRGKLLAYFCGRKLRTYPRDSGESSFIELAVDPEVESMGREVAEKLGLVGLFKIDLLRERGTGLLYVLEVNARATLWTYLGARHGVNLLALAHGLLLGAPPPREVVRLRAEPSVAWLNFHNDVRGLRDARPSLKETVGYAASLVSRRKLYEIFDWRDPWPFACWAANDLARRWNHGSVGNRLGHSRQPRGTPGSIA